MFAIGHVCIEYPTEFYLSTRDCQTESKAENAEKKDNEIPRGKDILRKVKILLKQICCIDTAQWYKV